MINDKKNLVIIPDQYPELYSTKDGRDFATIYCLTLPDYRIKKIKAEASLLSDSLELSNYFTYPDCIKVVNLIYTTSKFKSTLSGIEDVGLVDPFDLKPLMLDKDKKSK